MFNKGSLVKKSHASVVKTENTRSADKHEFEVEPSIFRNKTEAADSGDVPKNIEDIETPQD